MKRAFFALAFLGAVLVLGGCPIYPSNNYRVCDATGCYDCPDNYYSGACIAWQCSTDQDCGSGYSCDNDGYCVAGSYGSGGYDAGGGITGQCNCPAGTLCKLANGQISCVQPGGGGDAGLPEASSPDSGGGQGDGSSTADASEGGPVLGPCNADSTCGGHGEKCIDGQCAQQVTLCSDTSQCNASGSACVDGVCEARCDVAHPCPSGYGCDFTRGVCNLNPSACTGSGTSSCQGGATCVEEHCVPPCSTTGEGGAACPTGQVCVNGGCIPDQGATFACANDGENGNHHDCYPACDLDAGGAGCGSPTNNSGQVCKNVTIETGTYAVCGTSATLGSDCDPSQGTYCSSGVCIDGYCK